MFESMKVLTAPTFDDVGIRWCNKLISILELIHRIRHLHSIQERWQSIKLDITHQKSRYFNSRRSDKKPDPSQGVHPGSNASRTPWYRVG